MKPSTIITLILALTFALIGLCAVVFFESRKSPPSVSLRTGPNSYLVLLEAADELQSPPEDYRDLRNREVIGSFVQSNKQALIKAKAALTGECWVVLGTNAARIENFSKFKLLARSMDCEAFAASLDGKPAEAAESGLAIVRLGHEITRGGVLIDSMVGLALERMGMSAIPSPNELEAKTAREVVNTLSQMEQRRPPASVIWAQEEEWAKRVYGFKGQLIRVLTRSSLEKSRKAWAGRYNQAQRQARLAMTRYAARAFELEHGKQPTGWADLVPGYLGEIPTVPVSDGADGKSEPINFTFQPQPDASAGSGKAP